MGGQTNSNQNGVRDAVASLLGQLMPGTSGGKISGAQAGANGSFFAPAILSFLQGNNPEQANKPKAYVSWLFLDEQFNYQQGNGSGAEPVGSVNQYPLHERSKNLSNPLRVGKTGYLYIYTSNESSLSVYFDNLKVKHHRGALLEETHYYPFGLTMAGISSKAAGKGLDCGCGNKMGYNGNEIQAKEFNDGSGLDVYDFNARTYDQQIGRFIQVDPLTEEGGQESLSPFHFSYNNPVLYSDPDGECPNCLTAAGGAFLGGLIGGGVELARQLIKDGKVTSLRAIAGSALQGAGTGLAAGFTGGASLLVTSTVAGGANAVGGAVNRAIQGKETTVKDVVVDATIGGALGAGGKVVGNMVTKGTDNLSNAAKGKLGEAITEVKYAAKGYVSEGKAIVKTGNVTPVTGKDAVAKYDHNMRNIFTGNRLTVESKFNKSGYTKNQVDGMKNVTTKGGVIESRTTSQGLGNAATTTVVGVGAGIGAQSSRKPLW